MCHHQDLQATIDQLTRRSFTLARRQSDLTRQVTDNQIDISYAAYEGDRLAFARATAIGWALYAEQLELTAECDALETELIELMIVTLMVDLMDLGPLGAMFGDGHLSGGYYAGPGSDGYAPAPFPGGMEVVVLEMVATSA